MIKRELAKLAPLLGLAVAFSFANLARADEQVTTTTRVEQRPAPGITVGIPGVAGVQIGGGEERCVTQRKTVTNENTGTSVSRTRTNCE